MPIAVVVEIGAKRTFASALDWPGWSRSGRDEAAALDALLAYAGRYRPVAARAGEKLAMRLDLEVVERDTGNATTDFGAPGIVAEIERTALSRREAVRAAALVEAGWSYLADVLAAAPASLRKGPRGGGRERDAIAAHVADAEQAYARKLGLPKIADVAERRAAIAAAVRDPTAPVPASGWPTPYGARRVAWHAVDHAFEIEDRTEPERASRRS
jgi:hypothetical protein